MRRRRLAQDYEWVPVTCVARSMWFVAMPMRRRLARCWPPSPAATVDAAHMPALSCSAQPFRQALQLCPASKTFTGAKFDVMQLGQVLGPQAAFRSPQRQAWT